MASAVNAVYERERASSLADRDAATAVATFQYPGGEPFKGMRLAAIIRAVKAGQRPAKLASCPDEWCALVERCHHHPRARTSSRAPGALPTGQHLPESRIARPCAM